MTTTKYTDKHWIVDMLSKAFIDNKSVNTVAKNKKAIPVLMEYCFVNSFYDGFVFVNKSRTAAALCKVYGKEKFHLQKIFVMLKLIFKGIGLTKIGFNIKRENLINAQRSEKEYLHVSFIGVEPGNQGKGLGGELIQEIIEHSKTLNLPVYLETSTLINLPFYKAHGFDNFYTLKNIYDYDLFFFKHRN
ncbi:MAG TPA: GNAT family N-acetyltransferase [Bacteroidales bacterium]|nr:GNAT family N-acetyltransferase [Bacteroidales bacterium]HPS18479.1 GNAT family N-acetyltransferase [Bacteroidales bacterium]